MTDKQMYGCSQHIEEMLDIFIDEFEIMPVMTEVSVSHQLCCACEAPAIYQLTGSEVKATWQ